MYTSFFNLTKEPFGMTPDSEMVYMTSTHREALAGLRYTILGKKGFGLLTGDPGAGKTTLVSKLMATLPPNVKVFAVFNPVMNPGEFLEFLLIRMGFRDIPASKAQRLAMLQNYLVQADARGEITVLIIDEAHKMPVDVLEEVRLLGNFETPTTKLMQIVLSAQTELCDVLNQASLRQLKQRLAIRLSIQPLSAEQVAEYIACRWRLSGAPQAPPFSTEALALIAKHANGIPRLVNAICDNALVLMVAEAKSLVDGKMILSVCVDLDLLDRAMVIEERPVAPPQEEVKPSPVAEPSASLPLETMPFQTLRRYELSSKRSLLVRCAVKLGFVH
jgi:general secretion pathway protein A